MMMIVRKIRDFVFSFLLLISLRTEAQTAGDEDAEMFNKARLRDQKATDEALNGWWAASMKTHDQRIQWWRDARFGMFVHWGIYSLPAGEWKGKKVSGYSEHLMRKEKISRKEYLDLAHTFNPSKFDAEQWILDAKSAGMNYFIITAKHHDGFAMYRSAVSDFDVIDKTPFKRDPMAELAAAARKHSMKFGFYYSHAFDWEHPDAPGNDWEFKNPGGDLGLYGGANWFDVHSELLSKATKYVDEKAIPQIKELLIKYRPDILWFDTPHKLPLSENIRILKAIRETDPNVVVNGRLVRSASANFGDYKNTADRPAEFYPVEGDWEAIPTTNESYGFHKFDDSHKSAGFFIRLLAKAASRGGNLLMNIGPKGDGAFDSKDSQILKALGDWAGKNAESIYKTEKSPLPLQSWGVTTLKENKLYLHVFNWPQNGRLHVGGLRSGISDVYLLTDPKKEKLKVHFSNATDFFIDVPGQAPDTSNTVIVVQLKDEIKTDSIPYISPNSPLTRFLAFDADLSKGFRFGDGKTGRYYVTDWNHKNQHVRWKFRTIEARSFKVLIKYLAGDESGGSYNFKIDSKSFKKQVSKGSATQVITSEIAVVKLNPGIHELLISPENITQKELMKLLEVQLIPLID